MVELDPDDHRSPAEWLVDTLQAAIQGGEYGPGDQLPSYSKLSSDFGVAPNTVRSALAELRHRGLIVSRQGKGSYVRTNPGTPPAPEPDGRAVQTALDDLARRLDAVERRLAEL